MLHEERAYNYMQNWQTKAQLNYSLNISSYPLTLRAAAFHSHLDKQISQPQTPAFSGVFLHRLLRGTDSSPASHCEKLRPSHCHSMSSSYRFITAYDSNIIPILSSVVCPPTVTHQDLFSLLLPAVLSAGAKLK